jgi:hypothetical protein
VHRRCAGSSRTTFAVQQGMQQYSSGGRHSGAVKHNELPGYLLAHAASSPLDISRRWVPIIGL